MDITNLKIYGQGLGWGQSLGSQFDSNILSTQSFRFHVNPPSCVYLSSGVFTQEFSPKFSELLSFLQAESAKYLIVGDFNFHVNIDTDADAKKLKSLLHQFDLIQHVNVPTHTADNTWDLVVSRGYMLVKDIRTDPSVRSDRFAVLFTSSSPSPGLPKQTVTYRSWQFVDHDQLRTNRTNENILPSHSCGTEFANRFVNYFCDKIKPIRRDLEDSSNTPDYTINVTSDFDCVPLEKFRIVSQEEVRKIISS